MQIMMIIHKKSNLKNNQMLNRMKNLNQKKKFENLNNNYKVILYIIIYNRIEENFQFIF